MLLNAIFVVLGLAGLYLGGTLFVRSAATLAGRMGMSTLLIGLTVVAVGTSLPELIVSVGAALSGQSQIGIGNVIGSNIANIGLILGISGVITPLAVQVRLLRRELPLLLIVSVSGVLLALDGQVSRLDGLLLLSGMVAFLVWTVISARNSPTEAERPAASREPSPVPLWRTLLTLVGGLALLLVASRLTVDGATAIALTLGISELVIGITLVAVGTSLPELITSITAALQRESDIAVGNVVGSNIFNLLGILGTTAVVSPIPVAASVARVDGAVMIGFTVLLLPLLLDRRLSKLEAGLFLVGYGLYTASLFALR